MWRNNLLHSAFEPFLFYIVKISCTSIENFTEFNMSIHKRFTCTQQAKYRKIDGRKKNESKMERYTYFEIERRFFLGSHEQTKQGNFFIIPKKYNNVCVCVVFFFQLSTNKISTRSKEIALWTQLIFHIKWLSLACMYCSFQSLILFTSSFIYYYFFFFDLLCG